MHRIENKLPAEITQALDRAEDYWWLIALTGMVIGEGVLKSPGFSLGSAGAGLLLAARVRFLTQKTTFPDQKPLSAADNR